MTSRVEPRRRKLFGPMLYGTLAFVPLMLLGFGLWSSWPSLRQALEVRSLARGLRDPDPLVSRRSADGLASAGAAAVPWLVDAARDRDPGIRSLAFSALGRTMPLPKEAIPTLGDGLRDPDVRVRREAAAGLARFGPEFGGVRDDLAKAMADDDPEVRFRAAGALWRVQGRASEPVMRALLDLVAVPVATRSPDRRAVVGVIRKMGDEAEARAISALVPLVEAQDPSVRREAIECLGDFGPRARDAIPVLERALADDDRLVRCLTALALSEIEGWGKGRARSMLSEVEEGPALSATMRQQVRWVLRTNLVSGSEFSQPVHILRSLVAELRQAEAIAKLNAVLPAVPDTPESK